MKLTWLEPCTVVGREVEVLTKDSKSVFKDLHSALESAKLAFAGRDSDEQEPFVARLYSRGKLIVTVTD